MINITIHHYTCGNLFSSKAAIVIGVVAHDTPCFYIHVKLIENMCFFLYTYIF